VPVDFQEYSGEQEEIADLLADNHLADLAEIDEDRLVGALKELQAAGHDVGLAGFTEDEVARLTAVEDEIAQLEPIPNMQLQAFEHYDYLVFMFKDIRDWYFSHQETPCSASGTSGTAFCSQTSIGSDGG
jgi:hypothetical protein